MFRLVNCKPDSRIDRAGWYVVVKADDQTTFEAIHKAVCLMLYRKFGQDPHYSDERTGGCYNVQKLGGMWAEGIEMLFADSGEAWVGCGGGFMPPKPEHEIIASVDSEHLIWPDSKDIDICISRWPEGKHWYLSTTGNMIFSPTKFSTLKRAKEIAGLISSKVRVYEGSKG